MSIKLNQGIHVMHVFFRVDRVAWAGLPASESSKTLARLEALCGANAADSHPRLVTYAGIGGRADLCFMLYAAELGALSQMHRDLEAAFPPGALARVYSYISVTELSEYATTDEESREALVRDEKLEPGSEVFEKRMEEIRRRKAEYDRYRLYPELPDWEVMGFYPMSKRRSGADNWYALDFATRKRLMGGHARVGRKFAGRVTQLITGSTGLDDWEWGVTLLAHQVDSLKEIVYEMRFDEVSARYGEFGPFFVNMRLEPAAMWEHLRL